MLRLPAIAVITGLMAAAPLASNKIFTPYPDVPAAPEHADKAHWTAWARRHDQVIRARLQQGDLDSLVNLLLYGTSFTSQPRISMEHITAASKAGVLKARVDDLAAALAGPGANERLDFLRQVMRTQGIDPTGANGLRETGAFLYKNLLRVVQERNTLAARAAEARRIANPDDPASLLDRSSLFNDRGLSLDTGIFPDFAIEETLRDLKQHGLLREHQVTRVALIGPGLDFIDKNEVSAYDYYPPQTVQPFAVYDSLLRLQLAKDDALFLSVLDISHRVIEHLQRARERARNNIGYVVQLPRDVARPWPPEVSGYWNSLGDQVGAPVAPIRPPEIFHGLETRAVQIRPEVVLACQPVDLDIIVERLSLPPADRFDLIVATNIFLYYDAFEQSLALENAGAMLKPGGLLLTNDRLPALPGDSMPLAGITIVPYNLPGTHASEAVGWYRKQ